MFVSMNWIREFVNLDGLDTEDLIRRFTLSTAEVEEIYKKGEDIENVVVGRIDSVEKHPDSKKLHLLKVDVGDEVLDIVCGAPNVNVGMLVPVAKAGGRVPAGEIKKTKILGFDSYGMCCAADELGLSDDHTGLLELDDDAVPGDNILDIYPIKDTVFEVDNKSLTNRPDLWGHYGIAREFAAITGRELKKLVLDDADYSQGKKIPVDIRRKDLVYRYSCLGIDGIRRETSPLSMRIRLYYCGMRGINLLADITNYIMLEMGQPMHAFDASKVESIGVGTPEKSIEFKTLDGVNREADTSTLMIYNNCEPVAIAGIMGGLDSEITEFTSGVLLESANFDAVSVRKSSSRLGLRTDASMRYEKTLDPEMTVDAIRRFVYILKKAEPSCTVSTALTDEYVKTFGEVELSFDKAFVDRYTGIDISEKRIADTLISLGFETEEKDGKFTVKVPSWRRTKDVTIKADVIEEITRIYGYDNFELKTTKSSLYPVRPEACKTQETLIKDIFVNKFNFHEVHSYIWCDGKKMGRLGIEVEKNTRILNIPTPENGTIRNSMIPTLLTFVYENKSFSDKYGIFEVGRVVDGEDEKGLCKERKRLGAVLFGRADDEKALFKRLLDAAKFTFLSIKHFDAEITKTNPIHPYEHPKNTAVITSEGKNIGRIFALHPSVNKKLDRNGAAVCLEMYLDEFYDIPVKTQEFDEPSKLPGVDFDLSLIVGKSELYKDIRRAWVELGLKELRSERVIDVFDMGEDNSLTVRLSFNLNDRTLSMDEVKKDIDRILENLDKMGIKLKT